MDQADETRRDYLTIEGLDPADGKTCEILISFDRMQTVGRRSMGHAKECGYIVPAILQKPTAVFEGLRRDGDDDPKGVGWRCYCGIPGNAYHADGTKRSPYPGQVYVVFVNDNGVAYNWRWEKADLENANLPVDHQTRFRKQLL